MAVVEVQFYGDPGDCQAIWNLLVGDCPIPNWVQVLKQGADSVWVEVIGDACFMRRVCSAECDMAIGTNECRAEGVVEEAEFRVICVIYQHLKN